MKVGEKVPTSRQQRRARAQGFTETLQHARSGAWSSKAQAAAATARAADPTRSALGTRRALGDRASGVLRERREVFGEAERQASAPLPSVALPQQPAAAARVEAAPELRAIVRTLPIAIEAARVREGAPLSLALGRALSVDLRRGAGGLGDRPAPGGHARARRCRRAARAPGVAAPAGHLGRTCGGATAAERRRGRKVPRVDATLALRYKGASVRHRRQVVRPGSAKPVFGGSNPPGASRHAGTHGGRREAASFVSAIGVRPGSRARIASRPPLLERAGPSEAHGHSAARRWRCAPRRGARSPDALGSSTGSRRSPEPRAPRPR